MAKLTKTKGYKWNFDNIGGTTRVKITTGEDLKHLGELDPKMWTVLSCPVKGLEIDEKKPGYKHSVIYPRLGGGLSYLKSEFESVYGAVKSFWEVEGNTVVLHVAVPANTTATICLDGAEEVVQADGLEFVKADGCMKAEAGSGEYTFTYLR